MRNLIALFCVTFFCFSLLTAAERPILKVGLISDTHVTPRLYSCRYVKTAWQFFKKQKCDLVINCGDIADRFYPEGYRHYRNTIKEIFADGSKKPHEIYAYANHDKIGVKDWQEAFAKVKKHLEVPHDPYDKLVLKGYPFLVFPQLLDIERFEKTIAQAVRDFPGKPIFVIDHVPPYNTVFNSKTWGSRIRLESMNKFPQAVHISGHVHGSAYNELNIWQGGFTAVNAGNLRPRGGFMISSVPFEERFFEVVIMEVYKKALLFRRYSLPRGKEICTEKIWRVPLPFDPKNAPYRPAVRKANSKTPAFPAGARCTLTYKVPFDSVELNIPHAEPEVYSYFVSIEEKDAEGSWRPLGSKRFSSAFYLPPQHRKKMLPVYLSGGYFEEGKEYRISAVPGNFYGKKGKALSLIWRAPAKKAAKLLFDSKDPMNEMPFMSELAGGVPLKKVNGFYNHDVHNARLVFPDKVWDVPQGTKLRMTIDMHTIQKDELHKQWTLVVRNPVPLRNANGRYTTPPDESVNRYVFDFLMQQKNFKYYLLIREGDGGKIRFNRVKLEQLSNAAAEKGAEK